MGALWGSLAATCIGVGELFARRVINGSSALTAAVMMQFISVFASLGSVLFVASELGAADMAWGALSGLGMGVGLSCYFVALGRSSSTVVAPVVATLAAVIPFIYTIVRGADLSLLAVAGAGVAFVGLALIALGSGDAVGLRHGLVWGTVSGFGYGAAISVLVEVSDDAGVWPAVPQRLVALALTCAVAIGFGASLVPPAGVRIQGLAAGVVAGLSSVFALIGLAIDPAPTVVTQSMFPVVSVIVGFAYFGDSVVRRQIIGIALVLAGVVAVVAT